MTDLAVFPDSYLGTRPAARWSTTCTSRAGRPWITWHDKDSGRTEWLEWLLSLKISS